MGRRIAFGALAIAALCAGLLVVAGLGWFGRHEGPGRITGAARPSAVDARRAELQAAAARSVGASRARQILFGDLHVHTTVSFDAFLMSMPMLQGEGAHPQADACDFARYCSALDFWSITDHAEGITPQAWRETIDAIRRCNAVGGDPRSPDTVAFLGWEWSQVGTTPQNHYGHKNVILAQTDDDRITPRPIGARGVVSLMRRRFPGLLARGAFALSAHDARTNDLARYFAERANLVECDLEADPATWSDDCIVLAETPAELFEILDRWDREALVIPHGTTWGFYTPAGSTWDKQLAPGMHDPARQRLIEVYSGHGTSEVYRDWRAVRFDADGRAVCPESTPDYEPACQRAGEIVRARCLAAGASPAECDERATVARANAAEAGGQAHLTVAGYDPAEWLDAGQCRDCDQPAFNYRPGGSAQYLLALRSFDDPSAPRRFRFGFIGSSDNHKARPGTGYKEVQRRAMTESNNVRNLSGPLASIFQRPAEAPAAVSRRFDRETTDLVGFQLFEMERQASFFMTGGLVAVHADGRDRDAIWDALERREVYGTSGPRILLWFDLLNAPGPGATPAPMGSSVRMRDNPVFQVRAVGSFAQLPGCPDYAAQSLGPERLASVCKNECYNPSDRRRLISRIEVVRIRPQSYAGEPVAGLIADPWRSFACDPDPAGCAVRFEDPDFAGAGRDAIYYVRAFEEPAPAINAGGLRCERDAEGRCLSVHLCGGPDAPDDDCLAEHEPRAWSSPIFVDRAVVDGAGVADTAGAADAAQHAAR